MDIVAVQIERWDFWVRSHDGGDMPWGVELSHAFSSMNGVFEMRLVGNAISMAYPQLESNFAKLTAIDLV